MQEYTQSSFYFIRLLLKWKYQFLIITAVSIALACLFSGEWFIQPKYKSVAVVYPSNLKPYSSESESEQMLQLFLSADVRDAVVKKFNLPGYYHIDTTQAGGKSKLISVYESNVEIRRTQYESIEINVWDTDPQMACNIVKEIIAAMNRKTKNMQQEKAAEVVATFRDQLNFKKQQMDSINAAMEELRVKYQLLDYKSQAKEVTKAWMKAVSSGKGPGKDVDMMLRNLTEKGGVYYELSKELDGVLKSYNLTKIDYDNAVRDLNRNLTYTNTVTAPEVPDKKSYPIRWLIVVASVISANLFLFLVILLLDVKKKFQA